MKNFCVVVISSGLLLSVSVQVQGQAECFNYTFLNDSTRAQTYYEDPPTNECDNNLLAGWYRFGGAAGNQMADTCVLMYYCGTHDTGSLSGRHPSVADGAVHRKVCFTHFSGCCSYTLDVVVRNCGGFYVYKLQPTIYCEGRYCGNGLSFHPNSTNETYPKTSLTEKEVGSKEESTQQATSQSIQKIDYKTIPWNTSGKRKKDEGYFSTLGWMIAAFSGILIVIIVVMLWSRVRRKRTQEATRDENATRVKNEEEPAEQILNLEDTAGKYGEVPEVLILNSADSARQLWLKNDIHSNKNAEHGAVLNVSERNPQPFREQDGYTPLNQHTMMTPRKLAYTPLVNLEEVKKVEESPAIVIVPLSEFETKEDADYQNVIVGGVSPDPVEYEEAKSESSTESLSQKSQPDSPLYVNQIPMPEYENVLDWCQKKEKKLAYTPLVNLEEVKKVEESPAIVIVPLSEVETKEDTYYQYEIVGGVSSDPVEYEEAKSESSTESISQESEPGSPLYVNQIPMPEYENVFDWCQKKKG